MTLRSLLKSIIGSKSCTESSFIDLLLLIFSTFPFAFQLLDTNTIPQLEHLVFSLTQQVNQSLQQISAVFGKELTEIRKYVTEIDVRLKLVDSRTTGLIGQVRGVEDQLHNSVIMQLESRLNKFEDSLSSLPEILKRSLEISEVANKVVPLSNGSCAPPPLAAVQHVPAQIIPSPTSQPESSDLSSDLQVACQMVPDTQVLHNEVLHNGFSHKVVQQKVEIEMPQQATLPKETPSTQAMNGYRPTTPKISYSAAVRVPPKSSSPVHHSSRPADPSNQKQGELALPESPTEWKIGTTSGPLSMANFAAAIKGCGGRFQIF